MFLLEELLKLVLRDDGAMANDRLRTHLDRRLAFALSGLGERLTNVHVRLSMDTTGRSPQPRCEIEVKLRPRQLHVADTGRDLFIAVENAASRLKRSLARALQREQVWRNGQPEARPTRIARKPRRG
jgi:ribosomal subunit interface protein